MNIDDVKRNAFAMPLNSPARPPGRYRLVNREFLIATCRADIDALRAEVPELLQGHDSATWLDFKWHPARRAASLLLSLRG